MTCPDEIWIALLNDGSLIELHHQQGNPEFSVGDIYLGKVRKIVPSLNAAFVDVGYQRDAFLHYLDLGPKYLTLAAFTKKTLKKKQSVSDLQYIKFEKEIEKNGKIDSVVSSSQAVLVQVAKEPISNKGPRLCSEITLAGRYLVLVPFTNKISISQKIKSPEEKKRLKELMGRIIPKNFGVIIRTVAEEKKTEALEQDLNTLLEKWKTVHENLRFAKPPKRVLTEENKTNSILRDLLNNDFSNVHVNDDDFAEEIKSYIADIAPSKVKIVKLYKGRDGIFERFGINKQIKSLFGKSTSSNGGYLIITHRGNARD